MKKVRLGIIGAGNMGSGHIGNYLKGLLPEIEIVAVADRRPDRRDWARENLGDKVAIFNEGSDLIASGLVDAILIAVPHYQHPVLAVDGFKHNLHVMCEKPAGVYTKQVREMNAEADKHPELVFGMMFNQRTNCVYRKIKEMIDGGELGKLKRVNWIITDWYRTQAYYNSGGWRATWDGEGGGVLLNQNPHNLDLWQWMCGIPKRVKSQVYYGKHRNIEVEDDVTTYVEYENGATGVFITSTGDAHGTNRFEIQLDKAKIVAEGDRLTVLEYDMTEQEFSKTNTKPFGMVGAHEVDPQLDGENPQNKGVINAWGGAILRGEPLIAGGEEGINGLTLSNAMHLSSWLGKEITLPFDEDLYYNELMKRVATSKRKTDVKEVVADTSNTYAGSK